MTDSASTIDVPPSERTPPPLPLDEFPEPASMEDFEPPPIEGDLEPPPDTRDLEEIGDAIENPNAPGGMNPAGTGIKMAATGITLAHTIGQIVGRMNDNRRAREMGGRLQGLSERIDRLYNITGAERSQGEELDLDNLPDSDWDKLGRAIDCAEDSLNAFDGRSPPQERIDRLANDIEQRENKLNSIVAESIYEHFGDRTFTDDRGMEYESSSSAVRIARPDGENVFYARQEDGQWHCQKNDLPDAQCKQIVDKAIEKDNEKTNQSQLEP